MTQHDRHDETAANTLTADCNALSAALRAQSAALRALSKDHCERSHEYLNWMRMVRALADDPRGNPAARLAAMRHLRPNAIQPPANFDELILQDNRLLADRDEAMNTISTVDHP